jgi:hypothetical protein
VTPPVGRHRLRPLRALADQGLAFQDRADAVLAAGADVEEQRRSADGLGTTGAALRAVHDEMALWVELSDDPGRRVSGGSSAAPAPARQSRTAVASTSTRRSGAASEATPMPVIGAAGATPSVAAARAMPSPSAGIMSGLKPTM